MTQFFKKVASPDPATPALAASSVDATDGFIFRQIPSTSGGNMDRFVSREETLHAEILWTMKVVDDHYSYRSCERTSDLFSMMFPDSAIAKKFSCGERKCAYLCSFGLAPYFLDLLKNSVKKEDHTVLLFDESLNRMTQSKQMDLHVRMWSDNLVKTHYLNSQFMGHCTSEEMVTHFKNGIDGVDLKSVLQLSMDGPNVNWRFYDVMQEDVKSRYQVGLLNIGSCGLHIVNGAFKTGAAASGWEIDSLLSGLYWLFKESPARREDYRIATGSETFPLKFCRHRWVENVLVVERALSVWDGICTYVKKTKEKKGVIPKCNSWKEVETATRDPFVTAKLNFFLSVAKMVTPFLTIYQTDRPMIIFLKEDLKNLILTLMRRFIDEDVLKAANTTKKLIKLDPKDKKNHCDPKTIDVGYMTDKIIRKMKNVSELELLSFRMECKEFLVAVVDKLLEKAPILYPLVRAVSCLDPRVIRSSETKVLKASMKNALDVFVEANRLKESLCDDILNQFRDFIDTVAKSSTTFKSFDPSDEKTRADELYYQHMAGDARYSKIWQVVKIILILSHGQATVERGFSTNRQIEVENMSEQTYIAQRIVCDAIQEAGGVLKVPITKGMTVAAAGARQKYHSYLDDQRKLKESEEVKNKKKRLLDEIDELKTKKVRLEDAVEDMTKQADKWAEKAETDGQLNLISRSNSLRRSVKEKNRDLHLVETQLEEKLSQLKSGKF